MLGRGKLIHVDPDFCNQVGSGDLSIPGMLRHSIAATIVLPGVALPSITNGLPPTNIPSPPL